MPEFTEELPPIIAEYAEAYEKEYGRRPSLLSIRIAIHIEKVSKMLTELGRNDARQGANPRLTEEFTFLAQKVFHLAPGEALDAVQAIANAWNLDYMFGFNNPFNEQKSQYTKSGSEEAQTNG